MLLGVPTETHPGERRVALVPEAAAGLVKAGLEVAIEAGAGLRAGLPDAAFGDKGVEIVASREALFGRADAVLQVRTPGANPTAAAADIALLRPGQILIGLAEPLSTPEISQQVAATGSALFAMELIPRITRAQSMDVLSSMATIAGYKAVLLAASHLPRIFPLLMTAAGTLAPARVLIIGAGVAGLQAIATARRLGAVVQAYDVRPAVREQVESLGARFVDLGLDTEGSEDAGGYARAQSQEFYQRQQEALGKVVMANDVVITTAAIPGKKAPVLVTRAMVEGMAPGSVIVDLAAERGGNCELTRAGERIDHNGVSIDGPTNLPATVPLHASQMYAHNLATFVKHLTADGEMRFDLEDEITRDTLVTREGAVVHPRVRQLLEAQAGDDPAAQGGKV